MSFCGDFGNEYALEAFKTCMKGLLLSLYLQNKINLDLDFGSKEHFRIQSAIFD